MFSAGGEERALSQKIKRGRDIKFSTGGVQIQL